MATMPHGWAALRYTKTDENFLITYDKAMNFYEENSWSLTPHMCQSETYQALAKERGISDDLVYTICTHIGLKGEQKEIAARISSTENQKYLSLLLCAFAISYFVFFILAIFAELRIHRKIANYMSE
jgi:hypothetical protein